MTNECEHGQLKRQCPLCELEQEIKFLKAENQLMRDYVDNLSKLVNQIQANINGSRLG